MFRSIETTELSAEETHHHVLQFVYGARNYWDSDVTAVTSLKIGGFFSVQPAYDANASSDVKLLDQHHKLVEHNMVVMLILFNQLVEHNKVVMLILFNQLVMLITRFRVAVAVCITSCLNRLFWLGFSSGVVILWGFIKLNH